MEEEQIEMTVKIVLIGDSSVGKTNIMSKYLKNMFLMNTKATIGVEFSQKVFKIDGHNIKAQIWDTAGTEKYKAVAGAYYKGSKGGFVVYDITRKETFDSVERWVNDLKVLAHKNLNLILLGNKSDLEDKREVLKEQGEEKAKSLGCAFLETSALSGDNIEKAFEIMMEEVYKRSANEKSENNDSEDLENGEDISLSKKNSITNEEKKCCT